MLSRSATVCLAVSFAAIAQENEAAALANRTLKEWKVPGLALAVVRDGRVVHMGGYGVRSAATKEPVTGKTLFGIGSITKSFTVLTLGALAADGKLDWEKPVRDYMPDFRLRDPVASERATARDLVTHRTGLPRHDMLWGSAGFTRSEMFARLRFLEPSRDFRAAFQYNNLMYMTAGVLAERLGGDSWEAIVKRTVFDSAGMKDTVATYAEAALVPLRAAGHGDKDGAPEIPIGSASAGIDAAAPAGAIQSTIEDMARYLRLHLGDGELEGKRILPAAVFRDMRAARIPSPGAAAQYPGDQSYGMGLFLTQYRDKRVAFHTGTYAGYHALLWMLPEEKFGVVILMNRVVRAAPADLVLRLTDLYLRAPERDWTAELHSAARTDEAKKIQANAEMRKHRKSAAQPSHALAAYAGRYTHPGYGEIEVKQEGETLSVVRGSRRPIGLNHWHYDVFAIDADPDSEPALLRFETDVDGEIGRLHWRLEPAVPPIAFTRLP